MKKKAPCVAAVHDLSGLGRCSLSVVLPVLSVMGCACCALPTAYLSASTLYPASDKFVFQDLTAEMAGASAHWAELDRHFDAVYSGFLGSADQIAVLEHFLDVFAAPDTLVLVDPVMGDGGKPYRTCTPELRERLSALAGRADLVTPNLTEAAILLGERYEDVPRDRSGLERWLRRLSLDGRRSVLLTGVSLKPGTVGCGGFDRDAGSVFFSAVKEEPAHFPGTGDLFASVTLGALLRGEGLEAGAKLAVEFVAGCVRRTLALGTPVREGVQFEALLGELTGGN